MVTAPNVRGTEPGLQVRRASRLHPSPMRQSPYVRGSKNPATNHNLLPYSVSLFMIVGVAAYHSGGIFRSSQDVFLDLHCHSVSSDDSRATVEQYVKWVQVLRKRNYVVDGIVLTEHRKFDFDKDYSGLAQQYDLLILKGSELDTRFGHFLVYGVREGLTREIDFSDVRMDARELMQAARQHDAVAIPAHPGRFGIGLTEYVQQGESFPAVEVVEILNGGGRAGENERAEDLCKQFGYMGIGGSDAHFTSHIATCMTDFSATISNENQLVDALLSKEFQPVRLEATATVASA